MLNNFEINKLDPRCILCDKKMHFYSASNTEYFTCGNKQYSSFTNHFAIGILEEERRFEQFNIYGYSIIFFETYLYIGYFDETTRVKYKKTLRLRDSNIKFLDLSSKDKIETLVQNYNILG